jgi:hypothetical protein
MCCRIVSIKRSVDDVWQLVDKRVDDRRVVNKRVDNRGLFNRRLVSLVSRKEEWLTQDNLASA